MLELDKDHKSIVIEPSIKQTTFADLKMRESDIEDVLNNNISEIFSEDESMLIIGRQVRNAGNGRSDLTALDKDGNIVLIEIKRDAKDIKSRSEAFTFQAIRYVASYSKIQTLEELADTIYAPYLEKYENEKIPNGKSSREFALYKLNKFLESNEKNGLSDHQRIILIASGYDEQTLSAALWLSKNGIDICCYQLTPYECDSKIFLDVQQLIPVKDYIVKIREGKSKSKKITDIQRSRLPKINALLRNNVLFAGDIFVAKNNPDEEAVLQTNCQIKIVSTKIDSLSEGSVTTLQQWLRKVFDWNAVDTYKFTRVKSSKNPENNNKTIYEIRQEWMESSKYVEES
ncbi:hypothetical protein [Fibrobacter sp.]|uniref:hypothetical protein n=1 Tax=Fibrobacter sp. TaxID=35828 RepID=UPI00388EBB75